MKKCFFVPLCLCVMLFFGCSFDYEEFEPTEEDILPDLVMENVEYIRVKSKEPLARFQAERAERYEKQSIMILENTLFEQFGSTIEEINASGFTENATIELDSGNIIMENNVTIEIESEDIILNTDLLEWRDEPRILSSGENEEVTISMDNGTSFTGVGFLADARNRTWGFSGSVEGDYYFEDDDEEEQDIVEEDGEENEEDDNEEINKDNQDEGEGEEQEL